VVPYVKFFTFVSRADVTELERAVESKPEQRVAQRLLAREVTTLVHGEDQCARAERASRLLFGEDITTLPVEDVLSVFQDVPSTQLTGESLRSGMTIVELVARIHLAPSKAEARRLIQAGGVYVNNRRVTDPQATLSRSDAIDGQLFVIRKGQKQNHLVQLT
jgi:tyrosyl-tRNA synthetase